MLSHTVTSKMIGLQTQNRQHRRQQSASSIIEEHTIPFSSMSQDPIAMSFDGLFPVLVEKEHQVGITNPGQQQLQQHLQVAQQQFANQARPGDQPSLLAPMPVPVQQHNVLDDGGDAFPISVEEYRRRQHQQLDAQLDFMMRIGAAAQIPSASNVKMERSRSQPHSIRDVPAVGANTSANASRDTSQSGTGGQTRSKHSRPTSSQSMSHFDVRAAMQQQYEWINARLQRQLTPPHQGEFDNSPITPVMSPCAIVDYDGDLVDSQSRRACHSQRFSRQLGRLPSAIYEAEEDEGAADTRSPHRKVKPETVADIIIEDRRSKPSDSLPSPPQTVTTKNGRTIDKNTLLTGLGDESNNVSKLDFGTALVNSQQNPSRAFSENGSSPSPLAPIAIAPRPPASVSSHGHSQGTTSDIGSPRTYTDYELCDSPRKESMSPNAASGGEVSLEGAAEDTGVSAQEVQSYISEQDPVTAKWTCLYPDCGKVFGRKENIRSHVQTHLGDRPFRCKHCNKRFVRLHDLKRHLLIHSGNKPYECECGRGFARQDALTRHKQRGICEGALPNVIKKAAKRGRPRKSRPEDEERSDKAAITRKRNAHRAMASISATSESSYMDSPPFAGDEMMIDCNDHFPQLVALQAGSFSLGQSDLACTPPMSPCCSPGEAMTDASSPASQHSSSTARPPRSEHASAAQSPQQVAVEESQAGSPPELSHSSPPLSTPVVDDLGMDFGNVSDKQMARDDGVSGDFDIFNFGSSTNTHPFSNSLFDKPWTDGSDPFGDSAFLANFGDLKSTRGEETYMDADDALLFGEHTDGGPSF